MILKCAGYFTANVRYATPIALRRATGSVRLRDRLLHAGVQARESVHRDRGQDSLPIAEVMVRRLMADARTSRHLAHAQRR